MFTEEDLSHYDIFSSSFYILLIINILKLSFIVIIFCYSIIFIANPSLYYFFVILSSVTLSFITEVIRRRYEKTNRIFIAIKESLYYNFFFFLIIFVSAAGLVEIFKLLVFIFDNIFYQYLN